MKKPGKRMRTVRLVFKTESRALAAQVTKVIKEILDGRPVVLKPGQASGLPWTQDVSPDGGVGRGRMGSLLFSGDAVSNPALRVARRRKNVKKALSAAKERSH